MQPCNIMQTIVVLFFRVMNRVRREKTAFVKSDSGSVQLKLDVAISLAILGDNNNY